MKVGSACCVCCVEIPEAEAESKHQRVPQCVLRHDRWPRKLWDVMVDVATVYIAVMVPYGVSFMKDGRPNRPTLLLDMSLEVFFVLDILVNFRTSFSLGEEAVSDPGAIAVRYLKSWFVVDLIAAVPLDLLQVFHITVLDMVHLLKMLRLLRLMKKLQRNCLISSSSSLVVSILVLAFVLVSHWSACVWFQIGLFDLRSKHWHVGWLAQTAVQLESPYSANRTSGGLTVDDAYVGALYFAVSAITTVGFGNVSPNTKSEKSFTTCLMLLGAVMHALILANVSAVVYRLHSRLSESRARTNELRRFLREHDVPEDLQARVWAHAENPRPSGTIKEKLFQDFPVDIYADVLVHLFRSLLQRPLFRSGGPAVLRELAPHVRCWSCRHGETIVSKDQVVQALHLVLSGGLQVQSRILVPGSLIGSSVLVGEAPTATVRVQAVGDCTVHSLSLDGLRSVMERYPDWAQSLRGDLPQNLDLDLSQTQDEFQRLTTSKSPV